MGWRGIRFGSAVMAGTVLVMGASATSTAQAQSYAAQVIYSFSGGSDGADPMAGLIRDSKAVRLPNSTLSIAPLMAPQLE